MTGSIIFSEEEIRYYKALLSWKPSDDDEIQRHVSERPVGQFMFLVLGARGCGKTSLVERFCRSTFSRGARPPNREEQERGYRHKLRIEEQTYILNALELPSQHLSSQERIQQAVQITEAAILVYDVRSRASFSLLQAIHDEIHATIGDTRMYGLVLVGTNSDCDDEAREVPWAEGFKLAASFKLGCAFLETSAKTGDNVDKLFTQLGKEVLKFRWLNQQRREQAERLELAVQHIADAFPIRRVAKWKAWTKPWLKRRLGKRKASAPY